MDFQAAFFLAFFAKKFLYYKQIAMLGFVVQLVTRFFEILFIWKLYVLKDFRLILKYIQQDFKKSQIS
ncbi:hypothetical protein DHD80_14150 [Gramella sp. AN32]|nr:hypothetical protein [Gramella sp. AN32]